jgi:hypothetical protein
LGSGRLSPPDWILPVELWTPRSGALRLAKLNFAPMGGYARTHLAQARTAHERAGEDRSR